MAREKPVFKANPSLIKRGGEYIPLDGLASEERTKWEREASIKFMSYFGYVIADIANPIKTRH